MSPIQPVRVRVFHFASVLQTLARLRRVTTATSRVGVALSIAAMGVAASAPDDVLERASGWLEKKEVLCLRALSPRGRDVAKRAIARKAIDVSHVNFTTANWIRGAPSEMRAPAQAVTAMGQVFGAGCTKLWSYGISSQKLAALQSFVLTTRGGLLELSLTDAHVSSDLLVHLCRAAPNLVRLRGPRYVDTTLDAIEQIGGLCPKLKEVYFKTSWNLLSPAETWHRHFPNLHCLSLSGRGELYRPTALHAITEAARTTSAVEISIGGCHIFPDVVEAIVGTPLGDRLTNFAIGSYAFATEVRPEAFLAAARGFPRLTEMRFPNESPLPAPSWFAELALIRPLKRLIIAAENTTNAHVVAACAHNPLESLALWELTRLTAGLGDAVAGTQTAAVLRELVNEQCDQFRAADMLSLARACPKLTRLQWCRPGGSEGAYETEIRELITGRGGEFDYFQS